MELRHRQRRYNHAVGSDHGHRQHRQRRWGGGEPSTHGEYDDDDLLHASASEENAEDAPPPRREQKAKMNEKSPYHNLSKTYLWTCKKDLRAGLSS